MNAAAEQLLRLFYLVRVDTVDYGDFQEMIVAADDENHARKVAADRVGHQLASSWLDDRRSDSTMIGTANPGEEPRVITYNIWND
ncbi:hypothetical protein ACFWUU_40315 [Kribbella sp. NPDC058693]|uniref:hypothetical protein n=1 Tax=Kribbella sp. NPDC058693 TaxID=3346602 RepID=UPI0036651BEF